MSEAPQIPWGKVVSNFIWIVGAAVILTAFSYHEFLRHEEGVRLKDVLKRESFKNPFLLGLILVAAGVSASVRGPLLKAVFGCGPFLLLILFIKTYLSQK
jgi:hypothetical protein